MTHIINPHRFAAAPGFAFNNALNFDGSNDIVAFTQSIFNDTWSFSGWINDSNLSTAKYGLISDSNSNNYIRLDAVNNRIIVRTVVANQLFTGFTFSNSTWHHIAVSVNALSCRVWVDDVESSAGALTLSSVTGTTTQFEWLGFDNGGNYFKGKYDEWGLWYGSYLTDANVTTLYGGGGGSDVSAINSGTLWASSHHDESTGNTTSNLGSSGTLTLTNFPVDDSQWVAH